MRDRAQELRAAFDRAFADAPAAYAAPHVDLLRVHVAGAPYAIVLAEIAGLHADLRVAPMPSAAPELLGVVSVRNSIVPVYDLSAVVGVVRPRPRWLVLARCSPVLAFAFESFDGHARVADHAIAKSTGAVVRGVVTLDGRPHQVLDLAVVAETTLKRWSTKG